MAKTAAQLMVEFGSQGADKVAADARGLGRVVDDVGKKSGFMGTALGTAVGFGAIGLVTNLGRSVLGLGKGILGISADSETMKMSLETAVGPRTEEVFKSLQKFAKDTPFEFPELLQSTVNLENFGIKADQVIGDTGRTWTQIIGDTASAMNKTYDQATQAVMDATTGDYERLKEFGVKATVEGDKVKFSYMKNGKEMTAFADRNSQEMVQNTLAGIWNDKYQGAMEKQSRTFNGMWSTMQDNVRMTTQRMTGSIFGFAKDGLKHTNLFFDRLNVGLDRGMSLFDATMRATKFTLQDVFGKSTGNKIFAGIDAIASGFEKSARFGKAFATGVFNVGAALGAAFFGSDRKKFIENLPSWAQSTAKGISTIAEAGGDLFRSFQAGGIGSMWDTLTTGGEGRQIVNAVVSIAAQWGGIIWGAATDAASWIKDNVPGIVATGIDATVSFATKWGGILWGDALDAATWIKSNAPGIAATGIDATLSFVSKWGSIVWGDATDAASWLKANVPGIVATGVDATVSFVSKWGGIAWDTASDAASWIKTNVPGIAATGIDATLSFSAKWGGISWGSAGDAGNWIKENIGPVVVPALDATVSVGTVSAETGDGAFTSGQDSGKSLGERFTSGLTSGFESVVGAFSMDSGGGGEGGGGAQKPLSTVVEDWAIGFVAGLGSTFASNFATNMKTLSNPFTSLPGQISSWFTEAVGSESFAGQGARDAILGTGGGTSPFDELNKILDDSLIGGIADIAGMVPGWRDGIVSAVNGIIPSSGDFTLTMPSIDIDLGTLITATSFVVDQVTRMAGNVNAAWDLLTGALSRNETVQPGDSTFTPATGPVPTQPLSTIPGWDPRNLQGSNAGRQSIISQPSPVVITYTADTTSITSDPLLKGLFGGGTAPAPITATAKFLGDNTDVGMKFEGSKSYGTAWAASTFTGKFLGDNTGAGLQFEGAMSYGAAWAASTFTGFFDGDNSGVGMQWQGAMDYGNAWAGSVFTASFSVDTSGILTAVDVARQAARDIAAVMPHSPAKEGPLKEPITFDYIADNMRATAARLRGYAADGAGHVAGAFGAGRGSGYVAAASAPRGAATNIHIYALKSSEYEELLKNAQQGGAFANDFGRELQLRRNRVGR